MGVYKFSTPGTFKTGRTVFTSMLAGNAVFAPSSYESIATLSGNGSASQITFSSIPSSYSHLQVRVLTRGVRSYPSEQLYIRLNGDATSGAYRYHYINSDGSNVFVGDSGATTVMLLGELPAANETANIHSTSITDILDYTSTLKNKVARTLFGYDNNGNTGVAYAKLWFSSGLWINTSAVTSVTVLSNGAFSSTSSFALYGIKGV